MRCLVTGAAGALGSAVVRQLLEMGEITCALVRGSSDTKLAFGGAEPEIFVGDVLDQDSLFTAAERAAVIFHCENFPLEHFENHKAAIVNVLRAAAEVGASVVLPGNVWVYGPAKYNPVDMRHPLEPISELGRIKLDVQRTLLEVAEKAGVCVDVVHLPDFYGPGVLNDLVKPIFLGAISGKAVRWIGDPDVPHEFIYIDDAARALTAISRAENPFGRRFNAPGRGTITPRRFIEMAFEAAGRRPKIKRLSTLSIRLAAFLKKSIRRYSELLYLFNEELSLDGQAIKRAAGWEPRVDYEEGIRLTLNWYRDTYLPHVHE